MLDVFVLSIALSMDAFAVSIGLGSKKMIEKDQLAKMAGVYFGVFQGVMPLLGYLGGKGVLGWIEGYKHWLAFLLLVLIGGKMIFEALSEGIEDDVSRVTHKVMLMLAIATSIDAMAAGFSLTLMPVNPFISCLVIAMVTFCLSVVGVYVGEKSGTWLESKAEILGGIVLILIGFKMLISSIFNF